MKKPKMTETEFKKVCATPPPSLQTAKDLDTVWEIEFNYFNNVPMWTGWNINHNTSAKQKQIVGYMKPITLPPTRTDVVRETMESSNAVVQECELTKTIIT